MRRSSTFLRTLATPEPIKDWSLTSLKDKLIKIGAKVVSHGRYVIFQMAEVATNDRALAVSSWIAGGISRVGAIEQAGLKRQGLHVIDASKQGWGIINHDLFLSNAQIRQVIRRAIDGQGTLGGDDRD
jgi:hypothetical protein